MDKIIGLTGISLVWIAVLTIGVGLSFLFNGDEFLIRLILILPFVITGYKISDTIWQKYCKK